MSEVQVSESCSCWLAMTIARSVSLKYRYRPSILVTSPKSQASGQRQSQIIGIVVWRRWSVSACVFWVGDNTTGRGSGERWMVSMYVIYYSTLVQVSFLHLHPSCFFLFCFRRRDQKCRSGGPRVWGSLLSLLLLIETSSWEVEVSERKEWLRKVSYSHQARNCPPFWRTRKKDWLIFHPSPHVLPHPAP